MELFAGGGCVCSNCE